MYTKDELLGMMKKPLYEIAKDLNVDGLKWAVSKATLADQIMEAQGAAEDVGHEEPMTAPEPEPEPEPEPVEDVYLCDSCQCHNSWIQCSWRLQPVKGTDPEACIKFHPFA